MHDDARTEREHDVADAPGRRPPDDGGRRDGRGGAGRSGSGSGSGRGGSGRGGSGRSGSTTGRGGSEHGGTGRGGRDRSSLPPRPSGGGAGARVPRRPRVAGDAAAPPRPDLPEDEEPILPKGVLRELERVVGRGRRSRDVALALSIASEAIDLEQPDVALPLLRWAKHEAPRSAAIREALGVALYLEGEFDAAHSELAAYRRMTGRVDQNHLVADCLRASGRDLERVLAPAAELIADARAPLDRRAEAVIVVAGALADGGRSPEARRLVAELLRGAHGSLDLGEPVPGFELPEESRARALWLAAELDERDGDAAAAVAALDELLRLDPEFPEARERRERLSRSA